MSFVHILDDNTINKIAAGEVVERPASVVKELIENAIDARADKIEIEMMAGGTSYMRVTDNGIGMSAQDAAMAIKRHATSKLELVDDLQTIDTLGFRGEALPSIASVSRFSLQTRQAGVELGTEIKITGGKKPEQEATGCSLGTTIKVEDLFFNTPARKKFLKTTNTEGSKISEIVTKLAIANPQISFKLISNNKLSLVTPGNGDLADTLLSIYGSTTGDALLPLVYEDTDIELQGFVSKPSMIRSSRNWQTVIVNGRSISNRAISKAIDNAYHALIPKSGYPLVVLKIEVPQNTIDVNVHPQKSEMKFEDEGRIFKAVHRAVQDAVRPQGEELGNIAADVDHLQRHVDNSLQAVRDSMEKVAPTTWAVPTLLPEQQETRGFVTNSQQPRPISNAASGGIPAAAYQAIQDNQQLVHEKEQGEQSVVDLGQGNGDSLAPESTTAEIEPSEKIHQSRQYVQANHGVMVPIGQVDNTYIIAQDADGLYIIDQHAAHERILFDRFCAQAAGIPKQPLLLHLQLEFSKGEAELLESHQAALAELGFGVEMSGPNQFRLTEVPADIPSGDAEDFIREILKALAELHQPTAAELRKKIIATTACKAAIKAGFPLNFRQMEIILQELQQTAMPYTCPHGRPTILKFSSDELAKMFKRTGF